MKARVKKLALKFQNQSMWLNNAKSFLDMPNPRIFTLFIISSTATFSLGIAMIFQWVLYGRNHPGFHWMVYTASAITSLPILIWVAFLLFAVGFHASPSSDLTQNPTKTKAAAANDDDDVLPMVQVEHNIPNDQSVGLPEERPTECKSLVPVNQAMVSIDDTQALKRTFSLPLAHAPIDYSNFKRTTSLKR